MGVSARPFVSGTQIRGPTLFVPCNEEEHYTVAGIETTENYSFKNKFALKDDYFLSLSEFRNI